MKEKLGRIIFKTLQAIFFVLLVSFAISICIRFRKGGIAGFVLFLEKNYFLAIIAVFILYIFKAFVMVLPTSIICIAVSVVFPLPEALALNTGGYLLEIITGYLFGRNFGGAVVEKLIVKNKMLKKTLHWFGERSFKTIAFTRFAPWFPNDVMSIFYGASKIEYRIYCVGSLIGYLPWILGYSLVGSAVNHPLSIQSAILVLLVLIICIWGGISYLKLNAAKGGDIIDETNYNIH